jgi:hypothetical protein
MLARYYRLREKMIMNKRWPQINGIGFVCLLLWLPGASVMANPGDGPAASQPDRNRHEARMQQREQAREARQQARGQRDDAPRGEGLRRGGRLTPEERRDLRRQINEAGQDVYQNQPKN